MTDFSLSISLYIYNLMQIAFLLPVVLFGLSQSLVTLEVRKLNEAGLFFGSYTVGVTFNPQLVICFKKKVSKILCLGVCLFSNYILIEPLHCKAINWISLQWTSYRTIIN